MIPRKKGQPPRRFSFQGKIWLYQGDAAWHFLTLPEEIGKEIRGLSSVKRGWGSRKVQVTVGESSWLTSIFPDKKAGSYLLPLKAAVRKKEQLHAGMEVGVTLELV
ncbi:MAG: DUF1905 domain-containing protein [Spirochaetales bacterium]|nr:DUF1905 domain-containing protein [Spirochaetales bacterium]